jgi:hypothetical protein
MRRIAFLVLIVGLCVGGCTQNGYVAKSTVEKVDGRVVSVKVALPNHGHQTEATYTISDRADMDRLIAGLEILVVELKSARDQMPVQEPPAKTK